jgi:uncharacterized iron-regulated membrane protein
MTPRTVILKIHLYLGLAAAIFLTILGLTGSIMAFEGDINHWLHPDLWYVTPGARPLPENDLISIVQHQFPSARVAIVQFFRASNLVQVMQLTDGTTVYINPYDGAVLGNAIGLTNSDLALGYIHQLHLRLVPDPRLVPRLAAAGKTVVSFAGLLLCLLVPTGVILWWRRKSTSVNWKESWFRIFFDSHQAIGIYAALFLLIASITGIMIGFGFGEKAYYGITRSSPPVRPQPWPSVPVPGAAPIMADQAIEIARRAMPNATVAMLVRPLRAAGSYTVMMRVPEETSEAVHSSVTIDQYSGNVLNVRNFLTESAGYRLIRFNRSIHTGDVLGLPTHIIVSLSSLLLVAMVITGLVIWWKKLAV